MRLIAAAVLVYLSRQPTLAATPTSPDQADAGSIPVTAPVNVKSTGLKLSPEQLVVASMPWEGMDQPEAQRRAIFPRQDPMLHQKSHQYHISRSNFMYILL